MSDPLRPTPVLPVYRRVPVPAYVRMIQLIWFAAGVVDVLVGLRFLLKLFGASIASPFVALVYGLTAPLVGPFQNIFPVSGQGAYLFEPASLVALAIYPLIALGATSLIRILSRRRTFAA
ncbi:MAG TPA: YggT family protein [Candidatus Dormibacteraeota bacterium]|nr:YggT family protein [Candidatus Dormibacteraeota bacterium]